MNCHSYIMCFLSSDFFLFVQCSVCLYSFLYRTMNIDALAMIWCILHVNFRRSSVGPCTGVSHSLTVRAFDGFINC